MRKSDEVLGPAMGEMHKDGPFCTSPILCFVAKRRYREKKACLSGGLSGLHDLLMRRPCMMKKERALPGTLLFRFCQCRWPAREYISQNRAEKLGSRPPA